MSRTMTHDAIAHETSEFVTCRPLPKVETHPVLIPAGSPLMRKLQGSINRAWRSVLDIGGLNRPLF